MTLMIFVSSVQLEIIGSSNPFGYGDIFLWDACLWVMLCGIYIFIMGGTRGSEECTGKRK